MTHNERAAMFRRLHQRDAARLLVLPNAWDAMSARLVEHAGAAAIATTSCGVSWALGRPDGEGLTRAEMVGAVRRIVDTVGVPVSADVESGYGSGTSADIAATVSAVIEAGAVGVNLEDSPGHAGRPLLDPEQHAERIAAARAAARAAGADLFVNARVDPFLLEVGAPEGRLAETLRRARAYVDAGADGVFVPGVADAATIRALVAAIDAPLNVMAGPGAPTIDELRALGVRRVSLGPALVKAIMAQIRRMTAEVLGAGSYESLRGGLPFGEADGLFRRAGHPG